MTAPAEAFAPVPGYLNAATLGLPPEATLTVMRTALDRWQRGQAQPSDYDLAVQRSRELYAQLVGIPARNVAVGSQASVTAGVVGASLPDGANVLCVKGDFTSMIFPFLVHADRGVTVRHVPLEHLADEVRDGDDLVAFSLAQSADGAVADAASVTEAARRVGAMTFCDTTQAIGWLDSAASDFDVTVCSAYKWLCCPRGVAFSTYTDEAISRLRPLNAGWYAGQSVWDSCYGPDMTLAPDARRFDVSPAWLNWVGAVPSLTLFAGLDPLQRAHGVVLADQLRERLSMPPQQRPVLALDDPDGALASSLADAGCTVAARAGRVRIAFHLWNTADDVARAHAALR